MATRKQCQALAASLRTLADRRRQLALEQKTRVKAEDGQRRADELVGLADELEQRAVEAGR